MTHPKHHICLGLQTRMISLVHELLPMHPPKFSYWRSTINNNNNNGKRYFIQAWHILILFYFQLLLTILQIRILYIRNVNNLYF